MFSDWHSDISEAKVLDLLTLCNTITSPWNPDCRKCIHFFLCFVFSFFTLEPSTGQFLPPVVIGCRGKGAPGLSNLEITFLLLTLATGLGEPAAPIPAVANSLPAIRESMPNVSNRRGRSALPTPININQIPIELKTTGAPLPALPQRHWLHRRASWCG